MALETFGLGTWLELELGSQLSSEHLEMVRDLQINSIMIPCYVHHNTMYADPTHLVDDLEAVPVLGVETLCWEW